jgi:PilZ domain
MAVRRKPAKAARPKIPARPARPVKPVRPDSEKLGAPVVRKPVGESGQGDKRDAERIQILGEFHGEVMVFQPITVKEISLGGTQVETRFPLQLDSLHDFRLTLGGRSVVIKGRVAHCSISDVDQEMVVYRSGIEFVDAPERVYSVIAEFIEAIMGGRRAP